jgi:hypothetical protein
MRKTLSVVLACLAIGLVIVAVIAFSSSSSEAFIIDYDDINPSSGGDVIASPGGCSGPPAPCTQSVAVYDI